MSGWSRTKSKKRFQQSREYSISPRLRTSDRSAWFSYGKLAYSDRCGSAGTVGLLPSQNCMDNPVPNSTGRWKLIDAKTIQGPQLRRAASTTAARYCHSTEGLPADAVGAVAGASRRSRTIIQI